WAPPILSPTILRSHSPRRTNDRWPWSPRSTPKVASSCRRKRGPPPGSCLVGSPRSTWCRPRTGSCFVGSPSTRTRPGSGRPSGRKANGTPIGRSPKVGRPFTSRARRSWHQRRLDPTLPTD
ncbi:MAG: hypothetical protein AVDCRST_MAG73-1119, partial [uncultured Thermomicrobiales bacterium]